MVRSARRSGTMQTAWGRWRNAMACISLVAAISKLSGTVSASAERLDIVVGDVAAILAQMRRDPVGAGLLGYPGGADRVGTHAAAGVADGGDMVDVHAKAQAAGILVHGLPRDVRSAIS